MKKEKKVAVFKVAGTPTVRGRHKHSASSLNSPIFRSANFFSVAVACSELQAQILSDPRRDPRLYLRFEGYRGRPLE